jgi:hypothetical protein
MEVLVNEAIILSNAGKDKTPGGDQLLDQICSRKSNGLACKHWADLPKPYCKSIS